MCAGCRPRGDITDTQTVREHKQVTMQGKQTSKVNGVFAASEKERYLQSGATARREYLVSQTRGHVGTLLHMKGKTTQQEAIY